MSLTYCSSLDRAAAWDAAPEEDPVDEIRDIMVQYGGISRTAAERIWQWHQARAGKDTTDAEVGRLKKLIAFFAVGMTEVKRWGLFYAADVIELVGDKTMVQCAGELGVTKQALSKEANAWRDTLDLPESKSMRREACQGNFRAAAIRAHRRSGK